LGALGRRLGTTDLRVQLAVARRFGENQLDADDT
jgi:hypothetical protein